MSLRLPSRRRFVTGAGQAALAFSFLPRHLLAAGDQAPPSRTLNIGCIGIGGQGGGVTRELSSFPNVNIAALCDVNESHAGRMQKDYPGRPFYQDWRVMLEKEKGLDAVMIATPDHWHAPIALAAMQLGKHVYCEKPLSHTIEEARLMTQMAARMNVVTQMGNGGHAGQGIRMTKEWIDSGLIGPVREVHCWSDRPGNFWKTQGRPAPADSQPVPAGLDWNLWLGPAAERPFHSAYTPGAWRGFYDFGCGALGDMMVHNADPAWYALGLGAPDSVEAQTSPTNPDTFPEWCIVTWHFKETPTRNALKVVWYDGGKRPAPPPGFEEGRNMGDNGIYFVGDAGVMICGGWSGTPRLVPESRMQTLKPPPPVIPRSIGHRREWVEACLAGKPQDARAGFAYSGPFTEALLAGVLPIRLGRPIEWDGAAMKAVGVPEADSLIRKTYRKGFGLPG